jgi:hypothetical protein
MLKMLLLRKYRIGFVCLSQYYFNLRQNQDMQRLLLILSLFSLPVIQSCQSTKSATTSRMLRFNFEKGKGYDYETIMNLDYVAGKETRQTDMTAYYSMYVADDNGTVKTIKAKYERFKMSLDIAGMNIIIDSDNPVSPGGNKTEISEIMGMMSKFFGAIKKQEFIMKVNSEGSITEVAGFDQMAASIADSLGLQGTSREQMLQAFSKRFNGDAVKEQMERFLFIFPDKEVKAGDSWTKNSKQKGIFDAKYSSLYKVTDIEGDMVTVEEFTAIDSADPQSALDGEIKGELIIDSRSGLIVNADQDIRATTREKGNAVKIIGKTKVKGKAL